MPASHATDVLVVEDEASIAEALTEILSVEGYRVRTAMTASDARTMITERAPSIVLLDYMLGAGTTSEELLVELGARRGRPAMILYSATSAAIDVARRHGVPFIAKPFDLDALLAAIRSLAVGSGPP